MRKISQRLFRPNTNWTLEGGGATVNPSPALLPICFREISTEHTHGEHASLCVWFVLRPHVQIIKEQGFGFHFLDMLQKCSDVKHSTHHRKKQ